MQFFMMFEPCDFVPLLEPAIIDSIIPMHGHFEACDPVFDYPAIPDIFSHGCRHVSGFLLFIVWMAFCMCF